jgi:hypothetical protein
MYTFNHIVVEEAAAPVGATLLKTGQTTSYRAGDDGDLEKGRATSFTVLASNNPFGNTNRFTDELGGQTYTNNIVIDWSTFDNTTVLGYRRTLLGAATWNNQIDAALAVSIGSFTTGWRLANVKECVNIFNYGTASATLLNYAPFNDATNEFVWTSTTYYGNTAQAMSFTKSQGALAESNKTNAFLKGYPVRTFTVVGTTLS